MENNFLQSNEWRKFQEAFGRRTFYVSSEDFSASIIEHNLPIVGNYFYIPKGPAMELDSGSKAGMTEVVDLAKKEKAGWIRVEPENEEDLDLIRQNINSLRPRRTRFSIWKAPHDMQPRETLILNITKSEEELLTEMKSKTRYNIRLAEKKGVEVISCHPEFISGSNEEMLKHLPAGRHGVQHDKTFYMEEFSRLNKIMAERQGIKTHSDDYYRKMLEVIPEKNIKLYLAKYQNKFIAANIVIFYEDTVTYLHGASDDNYKNLMAPYLLQWRQIQDAKKAGCTKYDFFGVKVKNRNGKSWAGITRFKLGFAPKTPIIEFPGSYDIIICPIRYWIYRVIQKVKGLIR